MRLRLTNVRKYECTNEASPYECTNEASHYECTNEASPYENTNIRMRLRLTNVRKYELRIFQLFVIRTFVPKEFVIRNS